ncbi:TRAP transporter small permease [uncultured Maritimibacter sp.]|jgi:TRAP-type C4-dicarboxylate transport system permease small subunit|uniref:TRAP transporter small permease n=1 Tax=uncultured Maritimibacter sp. TaxID=991866 RepID=UPI0026393B32|nr:TRAP transporter small permease [uncultured Maritimibacter sp.]
MKPIRLLGRLHDLLTDAGFLLSTLGLGLMVLIYCSEVVTRYFLGRPLDWANDAFSNILCVMLFSMVPAATRAAQHIEINLVPEALPRLKPALRIFANLVGAVVCAFAGWMSLSENMRQIAYGILTEQNHPVPVWWMSVFITYGLFSSGLYFLRALIPGDAARPTSLVERLDGEHAVSSAG